jgi:hypothetical protein
MLEQLKQIAEHNRDRAKKEFRAGNGLRSEVLNGDAIVCEWAANEIERLRRSILDFLSDHGRDQQILFDAIERAHWEIPSRPKTNEVATNGA